MGCCTSAPSEKAVAEKSAAEVEKKCGDEGERGSCDSSEDGRVSFPADSEDGAETKAANGNLLTSNGQPILFCANDIAPSLEEHMRYIGFNPDTDENFVWVCQCLKDEPKPSHIHQYTKDGLVWWVDARTSQATWKHPHFDKYAAMLQLAREKKPVPHWKMIMSFRIEFLLRGLTSDSDEMQSGEICLSRRANTIECIWEMSRIFGFHLQSEPYLVHCLTSCLQHYHFLTLNTRQVSDDETAAATRIQREFLNAQDYADDEDHEHDDDHDDWRGVLIRETRKCAQCCRDFVSLLDNLQADQTIYVMNMPLVVKLGCPRIQVYHSPSLADKDLGDMGRPPSSMFWFLMATPQGDWLKIGHGGWKGKFLPLHIDDAVIWRNVCDPVGYLAAARSLWCTVYADSDTMQWCNIVTGEVTASRPMVVNEPSEEIEFTMFAMKEPVKA